MNSPDQSTLRPADSDRIGDMESEQLIAIALESADEVDNCYFEDAPYGEMSNEQALAAAVLELARRGLLRTETR